MAYYAPIDFLADEGFLAGMKRLRAGELTLDWFDATFGVRVTPSRDDPDERLIVLGFEVHACTGIRAAREVNDSVDFVLEAPLSVWQEMLARRAPGVRDAAHSINTLTHFEFPMRVTYADPAGHDKLYRFQESVQLVFDLAAEVEAEAAGDPPAGH